MNKQSNTYIVTYATVLVIVVAAVLSFAAIKLQPMQQANVKTEKMGAILSTIGEGSQAGTVSDKNKYIEEEFGKYITEAFFVDSTGTAADAPTEKVLESLNNLPEVFAARTAMPVFVASVPDAAGKTGGVKTEYVVPVTGKGLWGPVWGYIALNEDCNTIVGAVFDHKSETPGLGAEIATTSFENQFIGKQIFDKEGRFVSIDLLKGKGSSAGNPYAVDAVSGGTLTSNGVKAMLGTCLGDYVPFFEKMQSQAAAETLPAAPVADTTAAPADSIATAQTTEGGSK
ncbi:NADH:ubiquinone reductase (Na(+)-transporting) subunit C [uncultured Rikenella sp.]|uniref:NADH:ubiquinone reductase (Na(+)-transporting) subunit C n=1 Tax=uncultured Rikenella sp. TaxID=368003 RepID=UPI00262C87EB|nr:NADH:ubiquinone reductase (Na(+)-transporting) subunit C [uncultured Rikenella sp.]